MAKKIYKYLIIIGLYVCFSIRYIDAQPTPGDTGLGAASGNVVGGGADMGDGLWVLIFLSFSFLSYTLIKRYKLLKESEA